MTNEDPTGSQGVPRRSPRQGVGGSPVGSTLSIVLAVIAVIAGFLILRNITDDDDSGDGGEAPASSIDLGTTIATTSTTVFQPVTEGATVVVANANTIGGSAGRMSKTLETEGFTMGDPVNANETRDESIVQYDSSVAAAQAVAESVAVLMGDLDVETMPTPPPVQNGSIGDGSVLLLLGNDQADKTIEELSGESGETTPTGTTPDPSGSETGSTAADDTTGSTTG
jgi:hypothetical protein